jgi:hypothetical protein
METTTETNPHNRELTPGEIKIAFAQIEDRLHRIAMAQSKYSAMLEKLYQPREGGSFVDLTPEEEKELDRSDKEKAKAIRQKLYDKFDIPASVYLFEDHGELLSRFRSIMPRVKDWLHGRMTREGFYDMYYFFEEDGECDWGWALMETPFHYYRAGIVPENHSCDAIVKELESIGTRSANKNHRSNVSFFADLYGIADKPHKPKGRAKRKA